jgi:hypothetical protein
VIPHDGAPLAPRIRDSRSLVRLVIASIMGEFATGFRPTPDLGGYKLAAPIEPRPKPEPFDVRRRMRGGKRVDPVAERRRTRAA